MRKNLIATSIDDQTWDPIGLGILKNTRQKEQVWNSIQITCKVADALYVY